MFSIWNYPNYYLKLTDLRFMHTYQTLEVTVHSATELFIFLRLKILHKFYQTQRVSRSPKSEFIHQLWNYLHPDRYLCYFNAYFRRQVFFYNHETLITDIKELQIFFIFNVNALPVWKKVHEVFENEELVNMVGLIGLHFPYWGYFETVFIVIDNDTCL